MNDDSFCNILRSVRDALRSRCVIQFRRYRKKNDAPEQVEERTGV